MKLKMKVETLLFITVLLEGAQALPAADSTETPRYVVPGPVIPKPSKEGIEQIARMPPGDIYIDKPAGNAEAFSHPNAPLMYPDFSKEELEKLSKVTPVNSRQLSADLDGEQRLNARDFPTKPIRTWEGRKGGRAVETLETDSEQGSGCCPDRPCGEPSCSQCGGNCPPKCCPEKPAECCPEKPPQCCPEKPTCTCAPPPTCDPGTTSTATDMTTSIETTTTTISTDTTTTTGTNTETTTICGCTETVTPTAGETTTVATTTAEDGTTTFTTTITTTAAGDGTTTAAGDGTTTAAGDGTTTAAGDGTTTAAGDGTTTAAGDGTTTAAGDGTTTAAGDGTTTAAGDGTTTAAGDGTTTAAGDGTTTAAGDGTTTAAGDGTTTAAGDGTTSAAEGGTSTTDVGGTSTSVVGGQSAEGDNYAAYTENMRPCNQGDAGCPRASSTLATSAQRNHYDPDAASSKQQLKARQACTTSTSTTPTCTRPSPTSTCRLNSSTRAAVSRPTGGPCIVPVPGNNRTRVGSCPSPVPVSGGIPSTAASGLTLVAVVVAGLFLV